MWNPFAGNKGQRYWDCTKFLALTVLVVDAPGDVVPQSMSVWLTVHSMSEYTPILSVSEGEGVDSGKGVNVGLTENEGEGTGVT